MLSSRDFFGTPKRVRPERVEPHRDLIVVRDGFMQLPGLYSAHVRIGEVLRLTAPAAEAAVQSGWARYGGGDVLTTAIHPLAR